MENAFVLQQTDERGISRYQVYAASTCCVKRLVHGIFVVARVCSKHADFQRYIDTPELIDTWRKATDPDTNRFAKRNLQFQLQRAEHLALATLAPALTPLDTLARETAALVHGIPLIRIPTSQLQSIHPQRSRTQVSLRRLHRSLSDTEVVSWRGRHVTNAVRTALDLGLENSLEAGVIALDYVLHNSQNVHQLYRQIEHICDTHAYFGSSSRVTQMLRVANGLAESPTESLGMLCLMTLGITDVIQQANIFDEHGHFVARVDFLLRGRKVILEVDGRSKYISTTNGGFSRDDNTLVAEKNRTYKLERLGYKVVRIMWEDLVDVARFATIMRNHGVI